jgi:[ribosomal protein S5]-alanine N-acetyltransferase
MHVAVSGPHPNAGAFILEPPMTEALTSDRLCLRPISFSDLEPFHACLTHPEVRRYLLDNRIIEPEQVSEIIAASEASFAAHGFGFYALELLAPDPEDAPGLIGFCGYRAAEFGEGLELLFGLFPRYWGKGLGSEAARTVLEHVFSDAGVQRVLAATDTPNQRSVRVLQRLGMTFECRREFKGLDTVFYSLSREDYLAQRSAAEPCRSAC